MWPGSRATDLKMLSSLQPPCETLDVPGSAHFLKEQTSQPWERKESYYGLVVSPIGLYVKTLTPALCGTTFQSRTSESVLTHWEHCQAGNIGTLALGHSWHLSHHKVISILCCTLPHVMLQFTTGLEQWGLLQCSE